MPAVRAVTVAPGLRVWLVSGYAEARAALSDHRLRKDSRQLAALLHHRRISAVAGLFQDGLSHHMLNTDPPEHERLRRLVSREFSVRRVTALRPRITEISHALMDGFPGRPWVDFIEAFAVPLPVTVICELLGVPAEDRMTFRSWTNLFVSARATAEMRQAAAATSAYLRDLVRAKRKHPGDDLITGLVTRRDGQDSLTEDEVAAMTVLLLAAGHETTVNLLGNGLLALLTNPDQMAALRADRSLLRGAVEELLRYDSPVNQATLRFTAGPVDVGGVTIPEDEFVVVSVDAANHDPAQFPQPDRLDLRRDGGGDGGGHLSFGHGIHFCLGAALARCEAEIAFSGLLDRFRRIELAVPVDRLEWRESAVMRGLRELPIRVA